MQSPTTMTRRRLLRNGCIGVGAMSMGPAFLAACGSDDDSSSADEPSTSGAAADSVPAVSLTPTTLQLSWTPSVQFGGTYLGVDRGYYADQGLDITLGSGGPNVAGNTQTVSGAALMNISGGDNVARSNAEGAALTIVGMQYQRAPGTLLSLAEKNLVTPESLIGTRIAVAGTDTPALDAFLQYNDIDRSQIEFIPSQYDPAVLTADQADSIFCFYNDLPVALGVQGIEHSTMLLADFGFNPASQVYTVLTENLVGEKREQIISLLRAEILGWQDYKTDHAEAAQISIDMNPDAGLDIETQLEQAEVQLDIMYSDVTDANGFAWFTDETVEENMKLFADLEIAGASPELFDRSLLEEIYADGPTL
ncbi:putative ABC transporter substrate-binding protein [Ilumatobacter coccineus YM16-304]|uniref:Thiamine pyrimidine synthase n=2 Tax=Ilumatobacter coccineus TaxID=467094 RepID=A0A6C7E204_ILUCY|nr:putative ABC transporter substrate-binding protein [Ilumatobacter coccineus YM16-304]